MSSYGWYGRGVLLGHKRDRLEYQSIPLTVQNEDHMQVHDLHQLQLSDLQQVLRQWTHALESDKTN